MHVCVAKSALQTKLIGQNKLHKHYFQPELLAESFMSKQQQQIYLYRFIFNKCACKY